MKNIYLKNGIHRIKCTNQDLTTTKGTRNITRSIAIKKGFIKKITK